MQQNSDLHLRLDAALKRGLDAGAAAPGISSSQYVRDLLRRDLSQRRADAPHDPGKLPFLPGAGTQEAVALSQWRARLDHATLNSGIGMEASDVDLRRWIRSKRDQFPELDAVDDSVLVTWLRKMDMAP
jgi:hypothetical protein